MSTEPPTIEGKRDYSRLLTWKSTSAGMWAWLIQRIAALALIPAYDMTPYTVRRDFSYEEASRFDIPPAALVGLLVPGVFGRGPAGHAAPWDRVEVGYIGVLPLVLAALALILRRDRRIPPLAAIAGVGLLLALGRHAMLHGWFYWLIPGFDKIRVPARSIVLLDFGLAALATLGLDTLLRPFSARAAGMYRRVMRLVRNH